MLQLKTPHYVDPFTQTSFILIYVLLIYSVQASHTTGHSAEKANVTNLAKDVITLQSDFTDLNSSIAHGPSFAAGYVTTTTITFRGFGQPGYGESVDFGRVLALELGYFDRVERVINGQLRIFALANFEFHFFPSLTHIDGEQSNALMIGYNNFLTTLAGFTSLISVGDSLDSGRTAVFVYDNPELTTITGFTSLTNIGGGLTLRECPKLRSAPGLGNLRRIKGPIEIKKNAAGFDYSFLDNLECHGPTTNLNCPGCPTKIMALPSC